MYRSKRLADILFDQLIEHLPGFGQYIEAEIREVRSRLKPGSDVYNIGCGGGREILAIADLCGRIVGIDRDPREIDAAQKRVGHLPNVELIAGNVADQHFADASFDAIVLLWNTFGLLAHEPAAFLADARRMLRPGGKILISVYHADAAEARVDAYMKSGAERVRAENGNVIFGKDNTSAGFTPKTVAAPFRDAGFTVEIVPAGTIGLFLEAQL